MLFSGEADHRTSETASAVAPPPSQAPRSEVAQGNLYHSFSFPIMKTWGNQRVLRCVSVNGKGEGGGGVGGSAGLRGAFETTASGTHASEVGSGDSAEMDEVREKLLVHLREAADRIKLPVQQPQPPPSSKSGEPGMEAVRNAEAEMEAEAEPSSSAAAWPWKLRTRRRGTRVPAMFEQQANASPPVAAEKRASRPRSGSMERTERPNFSITLTREEIDEDIYAVTGYRARRRPRKRPRVVQKQLDLLFPGSWLSEITADSYKVPD